MEPLRVGIVGCGNISGIYFQNLAQYAATEVVACADLDLDRARAAAEKHGVAKALTTGQLLADPDVELVLNLTVPKVHAQVCLDAISAGKHVYAEKPLSTQRSEGSKVMEAAKAAGKLVGCAPDTFLGGSHQACRKLIDEGVIGTPIAANAFMLCHGHETWHPSPEFYYEVGGGPMFDMGPYYLTALVNMIGPVTRVSGSTRITFPTRTITSQPKAGKVIEVETPTHIVGIMEFASGAIGQITTSFDIWGNSMPPIEVYGTEGSLKVPDPNGFGGKVFVKRHEDQDWREVPVEFGYTENSRGVGVQDMAYAIRNQRQHRANGDLAFHVLDLMESFQDSATSGRHRDLRSVCTRPEPMPSEGLA